MAFRHLWEAENFVLNKTKGGELLVRVYCETGDTRTAKIESFFSGLFSCGAPRCRNAKFFHPPPTGINSSSGSALRSGGNVEARICAVPTCGPGVIKTRPECRYQPSARSYKRPKALKWIPRHIRCAVLFRTPRIAPELILRLQGAAERCRHSHTSQNNPLCASKQPWK